MRKAHAGIVAVSLWVGACASGGSGGGSGGGDGTGANAATGSGAETSSTAASGAVSTGGAGGAGGADGAGSAGSANGVAPSGGGSRSSQTRRAILAPERLATCTPQGAGLVDAVAVPTRLASSLGGCGFRSSTEAPTAEAASLQLDVFDTIAPITDLLACTPGTEPDLDFRLSTYGAFTSSHISSESWEVAFAVDDGERVHVGMQLRRVCQGVAASQVTETLSLELAGPGRSITLHRCEPIRPRCGAVP